MFAVVKVVGIFFAPIVEVGIQLMLGLRDDYCGNCIGPDGTHRTDIIGMAFESNS